MEITFKIIYIILALIAVFVVYIISNRFVKVINAKNLIERDIEMYKIQYSEQDILTHLDYIIQECLDYYIAMTLAPKRLSYISSSMETEMLDKLGETVQSRISPTLYSKLSLIYSADQIGIIIGEKIYTKVLEYIIQFNVENENKENKK